MSTRKPERPIGLARQGGGTDAAGVQDLSLTTATTWAIRPTYRNKEEAEDWIQGTATRSSIFEDQSRARRASSSQTTLRRIDGEVAVAARAKRSKKAEAGPAPVGRRRDLTDVYVKVARSMTRHAPHRRLRSTKRMRDCDAVSDPERDRDGRRRGRWRRPPRSGRHPKRWVACSDTTRGLVGEPSVMNRVRDTPISRDGYPDRHRRRRGRDGPATRSPS